MTHEVRRVRTRAGAQHYDQQIGEVIQAKGSAEAKEKWDTRKWQAATAGMSVAIILAEVLVGVSEIAFAITLILLLGLNWFIHELTNPRLKKPPSIKRRMTGATARARTKQARRRRSPARRTVRRR